MRKIVFLRHGDTENPAHNVSDHDRALLPGGVEEAKLVGSQILLKNPAINLIITSSARRACETAYVVASQLNYPKEKVIIEDNLYNANLSKIFGVINKIDDQYDSVILVGHNPGFTDCSNEISAVRDISLATCNYCIIEFDCEWSLVKKGSGKLLFKCDT